MVLSPMALYSLYGPLSFLRPSIFSLTFCFLYSRLSSLLPSVSSSALSPSRPSVLSTALCLLYSPLSPLWPSVPSTALCPLYGPLSPLRPSVPSMAICPLYGPLRVSSKLQGYRDLFCVSDNRDYCDNHDYHSSEMLSDNREIAIIALAKKAPINTIIPSNIKR
jgi:hypothetical protein